MILIMEISDDFKGWMLTKGRDKLEALMRKYRGAGLDAGVCATSSLAVCSALKRFGVKCETKAVETLVSNEKGISCVAEGKNLAVECVKATALKGKDGLTKDDPVTVGVGVGKERSAFHFISVLPTRKEIIDLTIPMATRPKWGILCSPYWSKYDEEYYGLDVINDSGCVLKNTPKEDEEMHNTKFIERDDKVREVVEHFTNYVNYAIMNGEIKLWN